MLQNDGSIIDGKIINNSPVVKVNLKKMAFNFVTYLITCFISKALSYRPVILIPGILSERSHMNGLKKMIVQAHSGTNVTIIDLYPGIESFVPLSHQLPHWQKTVSEIMKDSPDGVHLICHSQGGLVCQGIIEEAKDHNIQTFIALSSPLYGQFGIPDIILKYFPWFKGILREKLTRYMYTMLTQITFSIANFWRDPRKEYEKEYLIESQYLPYVLNHPDFKKLTPTEKKARKMNYLKLKNVVLVGGPDDGVIEPWESSIYGYYNEDYKMVNYTHQRVYLEDWFGLKSLDGKGRLKTFAIPGVKHVDWHANKTVFDRVMKDWLD